MNCIDSQQLYNVLLEEMGEQGWWPADSKIEIILGAVLVQNTNWRNAEKTLINLKKRTDFLPEIIKNLSVSELEALIRPCGFYKSKAQTIISVFEWLEKYDWKFERISKTYGKKLRDRLLEIKGVGFETADVFLVYIFDRPAFIADSYARRLYGILENKHYPTYKSLYTNIQLPDEFTYKQAQEFHGLIDEFGKNYLTNNEKLAKICSKVSSSEIN